MPSCCAASAVTGPMDATTVACRRSAACSWPSIATKFLTVEALVNVTASISSIEQHAVDIVSPPARRFASIVRYATTSTTSAPAFAQFVARARSRAMSARGSRMRRPFRLARCLSARRQRFRPELRGRQIDADAVPLQARRGGRPDGAESHALQIAHVADREQPPHEVIHGVRAREDDPVEGSRRSRTRRPAPAGSSGAAMRIAWARDRLGAALLEHVDQLARLFARARDDDAAAEERPVVEPAQVLRRPATAPTTSSAGTLGIARARMVPSVPSTVRCEGSRRVVDERGGFVRRTAVREQRLRHRPNLPRAGVTHDRAGRARPAAPSPRRAPYPSRLRGRGRTSSTSLRPDT